MSLKLKGNGSINHTVNTVDDLANISNPEVNDICVVTDEDRGGTFIYRGTGTDNDGTIFSGWYRQYDGAVNVKWFGARSITEVGYETYDSTSSIQNAINVSNVVYVPKGHYIISDSLPLDKDLIFYGDGLEQTIFTCTDNTKPFMEKQDTSGFIKCDIHSFWINYNSVGTSKAFDLGGDGTTGASTWIERSSFRNIRIRNSNIAFYNSSGAYGLTFDSIYIDDCNYGFVWYYGTTISFDNVQIGGSSVKRAFYMYNVFSLSMINCGTDGGTTVISSAMCDFVSVVGLNIKSFASEGVTVLGNDAAFWRFEACEACNIQGTYHTNLTFDGNSGGYPAYAKMYNTSKGISFSNINLALPGDNCYYIGSPSAIYIFLGGDTASDLYSVSDTVIPTLTKNDGGSSTTVYITQDATATMRNVTGSGFLATRKNEMAQSATTPDSTYGVQGQVVYSTDPVTNNNAGWIKIDSSNWKTFGILDNSIIDNSDNTYVSTAVNGTFLVQNKNTQNTDQAVSIQLVATGWSGTTTAFAGITALQVGGASTADLIFQNRDGGTVKENMRIKANGTINFNNLPTSSSGLSSGDIWNDSGTIKIV